MMNPVHATFDSINVGLIAYMKVLLPTWTSSEDSDLWPLSLLSWEQTFKILTASSHLNLRRAEQKDREHLPIRCILQTNIGHVAEP